MVNPFDPFGIYQLWWNMALAPWQAWARTVRVHQHVEHIRGSAFGEREVIHVRFGKRG